MDLDTRPIGGNTLEDIIGKLLNANLIPCPNCGKDYKWKNEIKVSNQFKYAICDGCFNPNRDKNPYHGRIGYAQVNESSFIIETTVYDQDTCRYIEDKYFYSFFFDESGGWSLAEDIKEPEM